MLAVHDVRTVYRNTIYVNTHAPPPITVASIRPPVVIVVLVWGGVGQQSIRGRGSNEKIVSAYPSLFFLYRYILYYIITITILYGIR